jgi:hypothetical protein
MRPTLLLSVMAIDLLFTLAAAAGAATGAPSPFMPPYPDFGLQGPYLRHRDISCPCPVIPRHVATHPHRRARATGEARN